jgi:ketosteroid isomerase-like protein
MYASLLIIAATFAAPLDDVRQSVVCAEVSFSRAAERRDIDSFSGFLDPEARFVSGGVSRGPAAVTAAWAPFFDDDGPEIRWRPAIVEVVAGGTLALSRGTYRIRGIDAAGNATESWGTFNSVWRRQPHGEWKVLFDAGGDHGKVPTDDDRRTLAQDTGCD